MRRLYPVMLLGLLCCAVVTAPSEAYAGPSFWADTSAGYCHPVLLDLSLPLYARPAPELEAPVVPVIDARAPAGQPHREGPRVYLGRVWAY